MLTPGSSAFQHSLSWEKQVSQASQKVIRSPKLIVTSPVSFAVYVWVYYISLAGSNDIGVTEVNWRIIYICLMVASNLLSTGLIIFRIIHVTGVGQAKTYGGVIEILSESSVLFSATYLVYLMMYARSYYDAEWNNSDFYPLAMLPAVTVSVAYARL